MPALRVAAEDLADTVEVPVQFRGGVHPARPAERGSRDTVAGHFGGQEPTGFLVEPL